MVHAAWRVTVFSVGFLALQACAPVASPHYPYAVPTPMTVAPSGQPFASTVLALHNAERAAVGTPALIWDAQLAALAESYARTLAASGTLRHSPRTSRPGQSENLWIGTRGAYRVEAMVGSWAAEKAMFRPGIFPNVSRTGNWADVAHYTQMIWRDTNRIGCGIGSSARFDVLVCRYAPSGNRDGRPVP